MVTIRFLYLQLHFSMFSSLYERSLNSFIIPPFFFNVILNWFRFVFHLCFDSVFVSYPTLSFCLNQNNQLPSKLFAKQLHLLDNLSLFLKIIFRRVYTLLSFPTFKFLFLCLLTLLHFLFLLFCF